MSKKAIVLLSGGLDSTTTLAIAKSQGYECYAMSFSYGQKHGAELTAIKKIIEAWGVKEHRLIELPIGSFGGSALTDAALQVPDYNGSQEIPITYVPARNTIFLAIALGWAEILGVYDIFIGANRVDYSGYPDCRPAFIQAFENLANLATKAGIEGQQFHVHAPLIECAKSEIIQWGVKLGVNYADTISCYRANSQGEACGNCDSCVYRKKGFHEAGITDPTHYRNAVTV